MRRFEWTSPIHATYWPILESEPGVFWIRNPRGVWMETLCWDYAGIMARGLANGALVEVDCPILRRTLTVAERLRLKLAF